MSEALSGPALNASNSDPLSEPPAPPPLNASNDPTDRESGVVGEMSADEQAAIANARSGKDQVVKPEKVEAKTEEQTADDALKSDKTPPWMKSEITKERNRRREEATARTAAETRATDAEKRLNDALEALKARETPKAETVAPVEPARPQRDAYETPEAYDTAVDQWATQKAEAATTRATQDAAAKAEADRVAKEASDREASVTAELTKLRDTWQAKRDAAVEKYSDYVEVAEADTLKIDVPMAHTALQADNGTEILYHLGKNPDEAARIAALAPASQIFEIGKLSATLAQRPAVVASSAPPPISPLGSSREGATDANREESMEEVAARVSKRERDTRTPMWGTRH